MNIAVIVCAGAAVPQPAGHAPAHPPAQGRRPRHRRGGSRAPAVTCASAHLPQLPRFRPSLVCIIYATVQRFDPCKLTATSRADGISLHAAQPSNQVWCCHGNLCCMFDSLHTVTWAVLVVCMTTSATLWDAAPVDCWFNFGHTRQFSACSLLSFDNAEKYIWGRRAVLAQQQSSLSLVVAASWGWAVMAGFPPCSRPSTTS